MRHANDSGACKKKTFARAFPVKRAFNNFALFATTQDEPETLNSQRQPGWSISEITAVAGWESPRKVATEVEARQWELVKKSFTPWVQKTRSEAMLCGRFDCGGRTTQIKMSKNAISMDRICWSKKLK